MKETKVYIIEPSEGCWLYKDEGEIRRFADMVRAYNEADLADWHECTNAEREQWEREHPEHEAEVVE